MSERTTLTLEDDVIARVRDEARPGRPLKTIINDAIRRGMTRGDQGSRPAFRVEVRDLCLRRGSLLDQLEGPARR